MYREIREILISKSEEKYATFQKNLGLKNTNLIGVRIPELRKMAKNIVKDNNYMQYLKECNYEYFEEKLLVGFIIGYAKINIDKRLELLDDFIPRIDNWAVTDCSVSTYKFIKKDREKVFKYINNRLKINTEFNLRFCIVTYLVYFLEENYINEVLENITNIKSKEYYVQMAVSWCLAEAYFKYPEKVEEILKNNILDTFIQNKTIQKIQESLKISKDKKENVKKYKK